MGFRASMGELKGYFTEQRKENTLRTKIVRKSIKSESNKKGYHNFKKALFEELDVLFYDKEYSRVVLTPNDKSEDYFTELLSDVEFVHYYDGEFLASGDMSIKRRLLDF